MKLLARTKSYRKPDDSHVTPMASSPMAANVLIYSGPGTSSSAHDHALRSLRRLLYPRYAVLPLTAHQLLHEPWPATCAALVVPGGADLAYCRSLNGPGNRRIRRYVVAGGAYFGLCAGGYYASARCEFELGQPGKEVVGPRELAFFPGACRGLAFPGFEYGSEVGARAAALRVDGPAPDRFRCYYNGGGAFVDADAFADKGVEILARYEDDLAVDAGDAKAAVIYCRVGDGHVVLTATHPE